jgi:hypothetical protein
MQGRLTGQDGQSDGDDDHPQNAGALQPADKAYFQQSPEKHGQEHGDGNGSIKRHKRKQGDGNHAPQHDEFTLGKVDDAGRVVDDIKADGNDGVYGAIGDAGKQILDK